jgi:hypothetical protein
MQQYYLSEGKEPTRCDKVCSFYCLNSGYILRAVFTPEAQCSITQAASQVWPPKSGRYSLIVLLMMGILVPETC